MEKKKIVGFKRFTSKKGKDFCVANCVSDFSDREYDNGCCGQKIEEIFMPEADYDLLQPEHIGKIATFEYEINNGKAYLVKVDIAK